MLTTPIRKKEEIELIKNYFLGKEKYRDYSLFVIGINTSLRISDLLKIRWNDVMILNIRNFVIIWFWRNKRLVKSIVLPLMTVVKMRFLCSWNINILLCRTIIFSTLAIMHKNTCQETGPGTSSKKQHWIMN